MKSSSHASSWMVSISQLVSLVQNLRPGANTGTVRNQFTSVGQHLKRHPSSAELNWLRQQNAMSNSTAHVVLITISAAVRLLDKVQVPGEVITQLKTMQTAQPVQPPPHRDNFATTRRIRISSTPVKQPHSRQSNRPQDRPQQPRLCPPSKSPAVTLARTRQVCENDHIGRKSGTG